MEKTGLNWRFVIRILGFTLCFESVFLFLTAGVSAYYRQWDLPYFLLSGAVTLCCGVLLALLGIKERKQWIGKREGCLAVTLTWIMFGIFGLLPFYLSGAIPSLTDAFFETISGVTTTGSTVLTNIDGLPKGLLFWRCIMQWIGGMGMIVFSLAVLPLLGGGAAQLFDAEITGITHDRFRPRISQVAKRLWGIYVSFTVVEALLLYFGPMNAFDAVCHAFTTMGTGGSSTKQAGIGYWNSPYVEYVVAIFMILAACNYSLYYYLFRGNYKKFVRDEELRWFLSVVGVVTVIVFAGLWVSHRTGDTGEAFRHSFFQVASYISCTGFAVNDFVSWGPFFWFIFILLMLHCGCAGSTSGGIKAVRILIFKKIGVNEFRKQIHPRAIVPLRLNNRVLSTDVVQRVQAFVALYVAILFFSCLFLSLCGMGFEESIGAAVSSMANVGHGLGEIGPSGSFAAIPAVCKWYLAFLMVVGRLEIFTVIMLFTPGFWRK